MRLMAGADLIKSHVCRSQMELIETQEQWKLAMLGKGWQEHHAN